MAANKATPQLAAYFSRVANQAIEIDHPGTICSGKDDEELAEILYILANIPDSETTMSVDRGNVM